jgi:hypothetical protein
MLYSEIVAVCSQIHTKHINTLCGQNVEFVNVKTKAADHRALKRFCLTVVAVAGNIPAVRVNVFGDLVRFASH